MAPRVPVAAASEGSPNRTDAPHHDTSSTTPLKPLHTKEPDEDTRTGLPTSTEDAQQEIVRTSSAAATNNALHSHPLSNNPYDTSASSMLMMNNPLASPLGSMMGGMYGGGGMLGGGMYGGSGMMMPGPLSGLNQFLFSVQCVIVSLSQAVQIVGTNTHTLNQLLDVATNMLDQATQTWKEMQELDARQREQESEEDQRRRRRLKALRWALVAAASYGGLKLLRRILFGRRRRQQQQPMLTPSNAYQGNNYGGGMYNGGGGYPGGMPYGSPYGNNGTGYGGYGYYG